MLEYYYEGQQKFIIMYKQLAIQRRNKTKKNKSFRFNLFLKVKAIKSQLYYFKLIKINHHKLHIKK